MITILVMYDCLTITHCFPCHPLQISLCHRSTRKSFFCLSASDDNGCLGLSLLDNNDFPHLSSFASILWDNRLLHVSSHGCNGRLRVPCLRTMNEYNNSNNHQSTFFSLSFIPVLCVFFSPFLLSVLYKYIESWDTCIKALDFKQAYAKRFSRL